MRLIVDSEGAPTRLHTGWGTLFVAINCDDRDLCGVFANMEKTGGCPAQLQVTCRAVSVALRVGIDADELIERLKGIRSLSAVAPGTMQVRSMRSRARMSSLRRCSGL